MSEDAFKHARRTRTSFWYAYHRRTHCRSHGRTLKEQCRRGVSKVCLEANVLEIKHMYVPSLEV